MSKTPINTKMFDVTWLLILIGAFFAFLLGSHGLINPDEGRYSEAAREMIASGNFITPHVNGVVFLDKPILYYWLQVAGIKLFGLNPWGLRTFPAVMGVFACLMTYIAGASLYCRKAGVLSALILATMVLFFGGSHFANMDLEVASWLTATFLTFIINIDAPISRARNNYMRLAYVFAALAFLTKGLMGIVFPILIIGLWVIFNKRWDILKKMCLGSGIIIFLIITIPWFVAVQHQNPEFLKYFFYYQQFERYTTTDFNSKQPVWYYLVLIIFAAVPWSMFYIQSFMRKFKGHDAFLMIWPVALLIFFSVPDSKLSGYILPVFPALALLVGSYFVERWDDKSSKSPQIGIWLSIVIFLVISMVLFILPHASPNKLLTASKWYCYTGGIVLLIGAILVFLANIVGKSMKLIFAACFVTMFSFCIALLYAMPHVGTNNLKTLMAKVGPQIPAKATVVTFDGYYQSLPIYMRKYITVVYNWNQPNIMRSDSWKRQLYFGMKYKPEAHKWLINYNTFWQRWDNGHNYIVFTYKSSLPQFKEHSSLRQFKIIGSYKNIVVLKPVYSNE
jgi:4-amino-4-deoxy-L-arabinose transferase-like glycosyltransferase